MFWFIYEFHNNFWKISRSEHRCKSIQYTHSVQTLYFYSDTLLVQCTGFHFVFSLKRYVYQNGVFLTKKINIWFETIMIISHLLWGFYSILSWFIFFVYQPLCIQLHSKINHRTKHIKKKSFFYKETILQWHFSKLNVKMKLRFNLISKIYLKSTVKLYNHIPCIEFE